MGHSVFGMVPLGGSQATSLIPVKKESVTLDNSPVYVDITLGADISYLIITELAPHAML